MDVSCEVTDPMNVHIHFCDRKKIDEQFPGLIWQASLFDGKPFEHTEMRIGEITIKFFT
jgi:hypothetical protein